MTSFYCDTFLCACPAVDEGPERFNSFLNGLLLLRDLPRTSWLQLCITNDSLDALFSEGKYPIRPTLEQALAAHGNQQLQAQDIIEIVNGLFKRVTNLESLTGIDDFLHEGYVAAPEILKNGRQNSTSEAFDKFVLFSAYDCLSGRNGGPPLTILTQGITVEGGTARIKGAITYSEGSAVLTLPINIETDVRFHQDFAALCGCISTEQGWLYCNDEQDYSATLQLHLKKVIASAGLNDADIRPWIFGANFITSFAALAFNDEAKCRKLLKACAESIIRLNLNATHALRINAGANSAQRTRGAYKAWRRDIDYEFHLHYWDDGNTVELSCVVVHNNYDIW